MIFECDKLDETQFKKLVKHILDKFLNVKNDEFINCLTSKFNEFASNNFGKWNK